jgi:hypothetical protein
MACLETGARASRVLQKKHERLQGPVQDGTRQHHAECTRGAGMRAVSKLVPQHRSGGADAVLLGSNEPNKLRLFSIKSLFIIPMNPLV